MASSLECLVISAFKLNVTESVILVSFFLICTLLSNTVAHDFAYRACFAK